MNHIIDLYYFLAGATAFLYYLKALGFVINKIETDHWTITLFIMFAIFLPLLLVVFIVAPIIWIFGSYYTIKHRMLKKS